jgi:hypothetical protein
MNKVVSVREFDWYWAGHGTGVDQGVIDAVTWYNGVYSPPANFVQLCRRDIAELTLNGRLRGVKVFERELCGERGNIMVGRISV